jgi:hypothetical protein
MESCGSPFNLLFLAMPVANMSRLTRKDQPIFDILSALMNKLREALNNPEAELSEFVLYLDNRQLCHAEAVFGRGRHRETVGLHVSDAIFISFKKRIPILAHEDLVRVGKAGTSESEFPPTFVCQDGRANMAASINQLILIEIPFKAGFCPQDSEDAVCYHSDPATDTLLISVPRTGWSTVVSLDEYLPGLQKLHSEHGDLRWWHWYMDDYGKYYMRRISADQDTVTMHFLACEEKDIRQHNECT